MELHEVNKMAKTLMEQHKLDDWSFRLGQARKQFGWCCSSTKVIQLSGGLCMMNSEMRVRNTLLHEIAHALVGCTHGHDNVWKAKCVEIGAEPKRCYNSKIVNTLKGSYKAICPICDKEHHSFRKVTSRSSCGACGNGSFNNDRILIFRRK